MVRRFVKKEYRGKGIAKLISKKLMDLSQFHTAICNEKSYKLLKKIGWVNAPTHFRLVKFVPLLNLINHKTKNEFKKIDLNEKNLLELTKQVEEENNLKKSCFIRDQKWFEWRFINYPNKHNLIFLKHEKKFIIGLRTRWKKFNVFKILFTNETLDKNLKNMISLWCKNNKFTFFTFLEKNSSKNSSYLFRKKLKYLSYSSLKEFKNFTVDFDDVHFADSDIGF